MITTTIGDIGAGHIGDQIARLAVANGYQAVFSHSCDPEIVSGPVAELGSQARAGTSVDAATAAGVFVVTISPQNHRPVPVDPLAGTVVIDTSHCCSLSDGDVRDFDDASTTAAHYLELDALREAFNELTRSEARLQATIDTVPSLVWRASADGSKEFLNQRWHEYTGLSPDEAHGWGWKVAVHPGDLTRLLGEWQTMLASKQAGEIEVRIRRVDGEFRWFSIRAVPRLDADGNVVNWFGSNTDIEDRKRAEERLQQDETEFRRITDAIPQAIIVLRPDGTALYANRLMLEYTGLTAEDVQAEGFRERIFHRDDLVRVRHERQKALERGKPFEIEQRARASDGRYRWFLIRYNPVLDQHGRVLRWYATGTDIHDRKEAEVRLREENLALREEIDRSSMFEEIVGSSERLRKVLVEVAKVARTDSTVLILGETGTGKELMARAIHRQSKRSIRAFIRVNCAAIPQSLIASELFGHKKGAFTGAVQRYIGRFEAADGGTLFLDEIGDLPSETQIALLRVLQEREIERVGSHQPIAVDVRVIAATNRRLREAVAAGTLRQDLFYRLNVFPIEVPSLRERAPDIPVLVEYFIERYAKKAGKKIRLIGKNTLQLFSAYDWPGNIRELQNVVERGVILCESDTFDIDENWLNMECPSLPTPSRPLAALAEREREIIEAALSKCQGRVSGASGAAALLEIPRQTLESKIVSLGINKHQFKSPQCSRR
jgi:formate hydrogenlyase transcriptional activator